jgi:hypothetical protein
MEAAAREPLTHLEINHPGLSFSLPLSFRQTDAEGIDSIAERYVDADAGVYVSFEYGMYSPTDRNDGSEVKRETIQLGPTSGVVVTRRLTEKRVAWRLTLYAKGLTMDITCRSDGGLQTAQTILESVRFPPLPAATGMTAESLQKQQVVDANRRALRFPTDDWVIYPNRLEFPRGEVVVLALKVLRFMERKEDARLALPHLSHPDRTAVLAAGKFLAWADSLPGDLGFLGKLLDATPDGDLADRGVGEAIVQMADPAAIPILRRAVSRGICGLGDALGQFDDESAFDLLWSAPVFSSDRFAGFHHLVRRSNKPLEPWMTPSAGTFSTKSEELLGGKWRAWWASNKATFRVKPFARGQAE